MSKPKTKADLEREIADMRAAPSAEDRLIAALAALLSSSNVTAIKHVFIRREPAALQLSVDMHEPSRNAEGAANV